MILVDWSRLVIAGIFQQLKGSKEIEVDLARHFILNMIRSIKAQFGNEYGELILAIDDRSYWRRDVFPYYKAHRKAARDASGFDWKGLFEAKSIIEQELKETFPYKIMQVAKAEADDIIGCLAHEFGNTSERIVIVASDNDFNQLLDYMNVNQWAPDKKRFIQANATRALKEKIICGDKKDGIPNIKSWDDTFVEGKRQGTITKKYLEDMMAKDFTNAIIHSDLDSRNFYRNEQLIDLSKIPENIKANILEEYKKEKLINDRSKLFEYFTRHRLRNLLAKINEF